MQITGHRNAVRAVGAAIEAMGGRIDNQSFDRLADLRGDASADEIKNGFVIENFGDVHRLCEIADIVLFTDHVTGCIFAREPLDADVTTT